MASLGFKSLPAILKVVQQNELTGILVVQHENTPAALVFKKGSLVHSQFGAGQNHLEGDDAVYSLLAWEEGEMKWKAGVLNIEHTIDEEQEETFKQTVDYLGSGGTFELSSPTAETINDFFGAPIIPIAPPEAIVAPEPPAIQIPLVAEIAPLPAKVQIPTTPPVIIQSELPIAPAAPEIGAAVATLIQMGLPRLVSTKHFSLNSHFANTVHVARNVAGGSWPQIVQVAQLPFYLYDDPEINEERTTPVEYLSRLNFAYEQVFGSTSAEKIKQWGRIATERAISLRKSSGAEQNVIRILPGKHRRLSILLNSYTKTMDTVRDEKLHIWKQLDNNQYWLLHYNNLYTIGRRSQMNSCHIWTSSYEAMLRWAGLANDWYVEEVECGCVNGTFNCVFAIRSV